MSQYFEPSSFFYQYHVILSAIMEAEHHQKRSSFDIKIQIQNLDKDILYLYHIIFMNYSWLSIDFQTHSVLNFPSNSIEHLLNYSDLYTFNALYIPARVPKSIVSYLEERGSIIKKDISRKCFIYKNDNKS